MDNDYQEFIERMASFDISLDSNSDKPPLDELAHYGVKGMKWGVRKDNSGPAGVHPKTNREARKDAREFTKAKMFYGEGAGTRRKLIKATVEAKSKRDPSYKKAFDYHVDQTDMSKRASQARRTRKSKDTAQAVKKTGKGIGHILNGNNKYANATAALLVGGYMYARKTGIDRVVMKTAKTTMNDLKNMPKNRRNMKIAEDLLRNLNFN